MFLICCTLSLSTTVQAKQHNNQPKPILPASSRTHEPLISLEMKGASFSEAVKLIGSKYKLNVISDSYIFDGVIGDISIDHVEAKSAIQKLAELFGRDMKFEDNIYFLQTKDSIFRSLQEEFELSSGRQENNNEGSYSISTSEPILVETTNTATAGAKAKVVLRLPQERVSLIAERLPLRRLASSFEEKVGWVLSLDKSLYERRFNAVLHNVTPGQCLEAITRVAGARQIVKIELSDAQKAQVANTISSKRDTRSARRKKSDELLKSIMKNLTQDQKDKLASGSGFELEVNEMKNESAEANFSPSSSPYLGSTNRIQRTYLRNLGGYRHSTLISIFGTDTDGRNVGF